MIVRVATAQLDETWTVTINGQSAQVYPDGSFKITNIPALDNDRDGFSDDMFRVTGTRATNDAAEYARSAGVFRIARNGETTIPGPIYITDFPFETVESTRVTAPQTVLQVGQQLQLTVTALLSTGAQGSLTLGSTGTSYQTSRPAIATVSTDGVVSAHAIGTAFITATNEGTTAVKRIDVVSETATTTVEGFVYDEVGAPAAGAFVTTLLLGGSDTTDSSGFFSFPMVLPATAANLTVTAQVSISGQVYMAVAREVSPVPDAITDAGVLKLTEICDGEWAQGLFPLPATDSYIRVVSLLDDGTGPALYAGGSFAKAGLISASGIARWDGEQWSTIGGGVYGQVYAITVFDDDGTGPNAPALYAAGGSLSPLPGSFPDNYILRWNGTQWQPVGAMLNGQVNVLATFDSGLGPRLYAAGLFTSIGGTSANRIAEWTGTQWVGLGTGLNNTATALAVFDEDATGSGPAALFAGGTFTTAGGVSANHVAKWDGVQWSPVGASLNGNVSILAVIDDDGDSPNLPALIAGGSFSVGASWHVAKWNGIQWLGLANGIGGSSNGPVRALTTFDEDGAGPRLFAFGEAGLGGGLWKWTGAQWLFRASLGSPPFPGSPTATMAVLDGPDASSLLCVGANYTTVTGLGFLATWDGQKVQPFPNGLNGALFTMAAFDADATGPQAPALYVGGDFDQTDGVTTNSVATWDGAHWSSLGSGIPNRVWALGVFDDDDAGPLTPALYAAGDFSTAGGINAENVARWNGTQWQPLADGLYNTFGGGARVQALCQFDQDGTGPALPALYAGGLGFDNGPGIGAIAKWDGTQWSGVGGGFSSGFEFTPTEIYALASFDDDGPGPNLPSLYAGGSALFSPTGTVDFKGIARWDGNQWSLLGSGLGPSYAHVNALVVFDDGTGPGLFVAGDFDTAGGAPASCIARWNGSHWSALGTGLNNSANALAVFDDGTGPALYVGGDFELAGGIPAKGIARWDGKNWSALDGGLTHNGTVIGTLVTTLIVLHDDSGPSLYAGGSFNTADSSISNRLAKWSRPLPPCP
jgi:hypothetical protein